MTEVKVNREKWVAEIKQIEADLKSHKALMRVSGYETTFDWGKLHALKAKATRMYVLRTSFREGKHPVRGGYRIYLYSKVHLLVSSITRDYFKGREDELEKLIIDGEPGWKEQFLVARSLVKDLGPAEAQDVASAANG